MIPVAYGDGLLTGSGRRRRQGRRVHRHVRRGLRGAGLWQLGVEPSRIDTIADLEAVAKFGVKGDGNAVRRRRE